MAKKLGWLDQVLFGDHADRAAINRTVDELSAVESDVGKLRAVVERQGKELLQLRAMVLGLVEVLQRKAHVEDAELELAVKEAWEELVPPPPATRADGSPYRDAAAGEPSLEEIAAAKALLAAAQDHHFSKRFSDARTIYQQIVDQYGATKQAATARQQLENLRKA